MNSLRFWFAASALTLASVPAMAGSDYVVQIPGARDASAQAIEVESFSWGASNPSSVAGKGGGAGKVNVQDLSMMSSKAPREPATGQATGRRAATASTDATAPAAASSSPQVGDTATFVVVVREAPTKASTGRSSSDCVKGEHIPKAVIVGRGQRVEVSDAVVTACDVANGVTRKRFTGHVTLMR